MQLRELDEYLVVISRFWRLLPAELPLLRSWLDHEERGAAVAVLESIRLGEKLQVGLHLGVTVGNGV